MLTKKEIKYLRSLKYKKFRTQHQVYIAEGKKLILQLLNEGEVCELLLGHQSIIEEIVAMRKKIRDWKACDVADIKKISSLKNSTGILGVFKILPKPFDEDNILNSLSLVLENIQDPGNFGTIIRTANWFGIKHIFCSEDSVDLYNPKVVQASMGSISKVNVIYTDLIQLVKTYRSNNFKIFGTFLEGQNIFDTKLTDTGFIILGNEGKGISQKLKKYIDIDLFIPSVGIAATESLNVASTTAIVCALFKNN